MKSIFASKTFWFNALSGAATVLGTYGGFLPPVALPYVAGASALINIGLRFVTETPVSLTGKPS